MASSRIQLPITQSLHSLYVQIFDLHLDCQFSAIPMPQAGLKAQTLITQLRLVSTDISNLVSEYDLRIERKAIRLSKMKELQEHFVDPGCKERRHKEHLRRQGFERLHGYQCYQLLPLEERTRREEYIRQEISMHQKETPRLQALKAEVEHGLRALSDLRNERSCIVYEARCAQEIALRRFRRKQRACIAEQYRHLAEQYRRQNRCLELSRKRQARAACRRRREIWRKSELLGPRIRQGCSNFSVSPSQTECVAMLAPPPLAIILTDRTISYSLEGRHCSATAVKQRLNNGGILLESSRRSAAMIRE